MDPPASIQGKGAQRSPVESAVEADSVAVVFPVVVADLDGVFYGLGTRVGKKRHVKTEGFGDLHEFVMEMGGCRDVTVFRVLPPGADEVGSGVPIRVNSGDLLSHGNDLRMIVSQGGTCHVTRKIDNDIPVHIGTERAGGPGGSVPHEVIEICGVGRIPPVESGPRLGIGSRRGRLNMGCESFAIENLGHDRSFTFHTESETRIRLSIYKIEPCRSQ